MARPPRISKVEWAKKNPPRAGESFDQYKQRYEDDTSPTVLESAVSGVRDIGRGIVGGGFRGIGSTVRAAGDIIGSKTLKAGGRDMETLADLYEQETMDNPEGMAGKIGSFGGRAGFEVASALGGAGLAKTALTKGAPLVAKVAPQVAKFMRGTVSALDSKSKLRRALATAGVNAPVDVVQGVGAERGIVLPGKAGAIAENVFFSGAGGAMGAAMDARQAAKEAAARKQITDPRRMLPAAGETVEYSGAPVPPLRAGRGLPQVQQAGPTQGPPLPTTPLPARERGVALIRPQEEVRLPATPATAAREAGEQTTREVAEMQAQLEKMSQRDRALWTAMNMPDATEEELMQIMAGELPVRFGRAGTTSLPLQAEEAKALRGVRPAKIGARRRTGAVEGELLSGLAGGTAGAAAGYASGETEEERLARALLGAGAGAFLGSRAPRFFGEGATSRAQEGAALREAEQEALGQARRGTTPPSAGQPMSTLPENRRPLVERSNLSAAERFLVEEEIKRIEPTITRPVTEADWRREVAKTINEKDPRYFDALDPKRATAAEAGAMLTLHKNLREQITERIQRMHASNDLDEIEALTAEIDNMDQTATRLLSQLMKADTEAGRSLASRRFMAQQMNNPAYWHIKGAKAKGQYGILTPDEKLQIDKLVAAGDSEKLLQYMASLQKSSKLEQVAQLRSAGLLTALPGRLRDLISTSANYLSTTAQRYPGMVVDMGLARLAAKKVGGTAEQFRTVAAPTAMELSEAAAGARKGLESAAASMGYGKKNLREWVDHIRTAEIDPDMMRQLDLPSVINIDLFGTGTRAGRTANVIADTYSKGVMRLSGVTDKVLRQAALQGSLVEQARLGAIRRGLKGQQADDFIRQTIANPDDETLLNAISAAEYITFTNDGRIADALAGAIERTAAALGRNNPGTGALVRAGARLLIPFRRTPANILSRALEYAPGTGLISIPRAALGWQRELAKAALTGTVQGTQALAKQRKLVDLLTKQATGVGMFALGAHLYNQGVLTGEFPEDPAEQEQWRTEGKQPESILIGGQWLPIARISPYGSMMTLAASVLKNAESNPERSLEGELVAGGLTTARSILNQPMVTGPKEALETVTGRAQDGEATLNRFVQNMAGSFVPSFVAQAARAEGTQRQPQSVGEAITSRIPGMQETAPARLNIFGEPVQKAEGLLNTMVNPLTGTPDVRQRDPLVKEMAAVGVSVPAMKRKKGESLEMYQYRQREAGAFVREDLTTLFNDPDYQSAPRDEKQRLIRATVEKARRDLDAYLRASYNITSEE